MSLGERSIILQLGKWMLSLILKKSFSSILQIYTDFDEIRQEIENETERISGNNKVNVALSVVVLP